MPRSSTRSLADTLASIEEQFELKKDVLDSLVQHFQSLMDYGLANQGADMAMIPTFLTGVADGTEIGVYLALDLGGTNLRVCQVNLQGKGQFELTQEKFKVSDALKQGPVGDLMDHIAASVEAFLQHHGGASSMDALSMGFTFSFPVEQTAIDAGTLIKWTKGFNCPDALGKDVIQLLQAALDRKQMKVKVTALVNDTVGALLAHAYQSGGAFIGAIYGTGTNGAYVANLDEVKKLKLRQEGPDQRKPEKMLINTEWGGYDDDAQSREAGLPITSFDNYVDRTSIRPRNHCFEKMISGMYLGEVARAVMISLIDELLLFGGRSSFKMNEQYGFDTANISAILGSSDDKTTRCVLIDEMGMDERFVSEQDVKTVQQVCKFVAVRAARLSAIPIAATILHTDEASRLKSPDDKIHVGVDGSVVEFLPGFQDEMKKALTEVLGDGVADKVLFGLAKDGSGVGAALCALQADKQTKEGSHVVAIRD